MSTATVNPNGGQAQTITYNYDAQGRLTTKAEGGALVYNSSSPFHAVKSTSAGSTFGYDPNGNMTTRNNVGGKNYTLTYDPENRLTGVSGGASASYVYDGDGNRVLGTVNGVTTVYIGNYYEIRLPNSPVTYYYAGGQRVAQRPGGGPAQYLFSDHLGSTALVTDGSLNLVSEIRYNPWGGVRYTGGAAPAGNAFTYTGQRQEADLGLMFYQARWYDSYLNQFLTPDSIVPDPYNPIDYDRYTYARNNPVNFNDPTGHALSAFDDGGYKNECPVGTCYIEQVGSIPDTPYYGVTSLDQVVLNTSSGGGSMDAGTNTLPDVTDKQRTAKQPNAKEPSSVAGGLSALSDLAGIVRNALIDYSPGKINVFAFYKVQDSQYSVVSLDVQNPSGADVSVIGVSFSSNPVTYASQPGSSVGPGPMAYASQPGPGIGPANGYYGFPPVAGRQKTTTISLVPSGYNGNPTNTFSINQSVMITIRLVHTQTGLPYRKIQDNIR